MLIFEYQNDTIKLASSLSGEAMAETPERYLYFMNYWEFQCLMKQVKRLKNNPDAGIDTQLYKMIATSFAVSEPKHHFLYILFDTPYCVVWVTSMEHQQIVDVIDTTINFVGRLLRQLPRPERGEACLKGKIGLG